MPEIMFISVVLPLPFSPSSDRISPRHTSRLTSWLATTEPNRFVMACNIWGKGMIKIIPILMGVVVPYTLVLILSLCGVISPESGAFVSFAGVQEAQIVGLQQFVLPKFNVSAILVMKAFGSCSLNITLLVAVQIPMTGHAVPGNPNTSKLQIGRAHV